MQDVYTFRHMRRLGKREMDERILTNSMYASPNAIAMAASRIDRKATRSSGIALWEYTGPNALHAKSYSIDHRISFVGSYNLDPRGAWVETELLLLSQALPLRKSWRTCSRDTWSTLCS